MAHEMQNAPRDLMSVILLWLATARNVHDTRCQGKQVGQVEIKFGHGRALSAQHHVGTLCGLVTLLLLQG